DRGVALPVDVAALARACAARAWPAPVELEPHAHEDARAHAGTIVSGRGALLAAAIDNLVANAAHFAEPGTPVLVAVRPRGDALRVIVRNRGPALSPDAQRRVWDRFYST